jgi:hypothetical protein
VAAQPQDQPTEPEYRPPQARTKAAKLPARSLRFPPEYGRPIRKGWVTRLVREWNDRKVGTLLVSFRDDGDYYVMAGNHRVKARVQDGDADFMFDCLVYYGLTLDQEAAIYLAQDAERLRHTTADDFPAMLARGDHDALGVQAILDDLGLEIAPYGESGFRKSRVRAVSALLESYAANGPDNLRLALTLLRDEWGEEAPHLASAKKSIYSEATVNSLPAFFRLYDTGDSPLEIPWLRHAMRKQGIVAWEEQWQRHRMASKNRPHGGVAIVYGVLSWLDLYNYGRREKNRLD